MNSPHTGATAASSRRIHPSIKMALVLLVLVSVAILVSRHARQAAPEPAFVWLDPAQFARQIRPGKLKMLYYKGLNLTAPLWQRFRTPKTQIQISSKILAIHGFTLAQFRAGKAIATNQSGMGAWILSASELNELRQHLKEADGVDVVSSPTISTSDRMRATMFTGQTYPPSLTPVGVVIDVTPKIASHQFQLAMSAMYSEPDQGGTATSLIRTNLSASCRVWLPNAGGILITGPASGNTNYWLILSTTAIDGFGNPIKL